MKLAKKAVLFIGYVFAGILVSSLLQNILLPGIFIIPFKLGSEPFTCITLDQIIKSITVIIFAGAHYFMLDRNRQVLNYFTYTEKFIAFLIWILTATLTNPKYEFWH